MRRRFIILLLGLSVVWGLRAQTAERSDSAVYQGLNLRLDIGTPVLEMARTRAKVQAYEVGLNVDLMHRFFPTFELGYGRADRTADGGRYIGQGGFGRVGLDISMLRKYADPDNFLLIGIRVGTAVQGYELRDVVVQNDYWQTVGQTNFSHKVGTDAWGEVVAGVQVKVYKRFTMGWYARLRILMTRNTHGKASTYYIPGYGYRQNTNWGLNYYVGWKF